jgi:hypothetical protein
VTSPSTIITVKKPADQLQIPGDQLIDAGPLHLEDDRAAAAAAGRVRLGKRGTGQRLGVNVLEDLADTGAQFFFDHCLDRRPRRGGDVVLQFGQLAGHRRWQQVGGGWDATWPSLTKIGPASSSASRSRRASGPGAPGSARRPPRNPLSPCRAAIRASCAERRALCAAARRARHGRGQQLGQHGQQHRRHHRGDHHQGGDLAGVAPVHQEPGNETRDQAGEAGQQRLPQ